MHTLILPLATISHEPVIPVYKPLLENQVLSEIFDEKCTIVHCRYFNEEESMHRIWPTTYLIQENKIRKKLIQAYNITLYPEWMITPRGKVVFTLLFEGLDDDCVLFDLLEDIPDSGAFYCSAIKRNSSDVYIVDVGLKN